MMMKQMDDRVAQVSEKKIDFKAKLQKTRIKKSALTPRQEASGDQSARSASRS